MKKLIHKIQNIKNLLKTKPYIYTYPHYYKKLKISEKTVLIESTHGRDLSGHLFYIAQELLENYKHLEVYVVAQDIEKMKKFLKDNNLDTLKIVEHLSKDYCKLLASAKYLLNDTTFYQFFIKKEGQTYINTWHGTPLKCLGKDQERLVSMSNVQRNFYMVDELIVSNNYTKKHLAGAMNLNKVFEGSLSVAPSPRNSILLNDDKRRKNRIALGIQEKKVYFYMPTWRGTVDTINNDHGKLLSDLKMISDSLAPNEKFFVKLHPFQESVDLTEIPKIELMPETYEVYDFLTAVDVLITDYSSIMYDFAVTRREVILYMYDKEEYFSTRGTYDDVERYPFTKVEYITDLIDAMQNPKNLACYQDFITEFCPIDSKDGTKIFCSYIFDGQKDNQIKTSKLRNDKENVFILSGGFWANGITTALLNIFDNIDLEKYNYITIFEKGQVRPELEDRIRNLPSAITYYPMMGEVTATLWERVIYRLYMRSEGFSRGPVARVSGKVLQREIKRLFGDLEINHFIHYTGFDRKYAALMTQFDESVNTIIYCHTDMFAEYKAKRKQGLNPYSKKIIFSAYKKANKVALVNRNLKPDLAKAFPKIEKKLYVANNFLGESRVQSLGSLELMNTIIDANFDYAQTQAINFNSEKNEMIPGQIKENLFRTDQNLHLYQEISLASNQDEDVLEKIKRLEDAYTLQRLGSEKISLLNDLKNDSITVFINIGRYSLEKGHERLIAAFEKVYMKNKNTRLVIVAPHGPLKRHTLQWALQSSAHHAIYILGSMNNPYPLLKACDAFILSSYFEGLGLVVYESLALDTTPITVNLPGPTEYLEGDEAIIVDNSEEGLVVGMTRFLEGDIPTGQFDFDKWNKKSYEEFNNLFER